MDLDLTTAKDIATIAAPLTTAIIKTWLEPKIASLTKYLKTDKALFEHSLSSKFQEYLLRTYEKNSFLSVMVFQNQQKKLDDIYIPLTLEKARAKDTVLVDGYKEELVPKYEKVLIRDTAGMGKSTLMKRLFLSCVGANEGVPVFIELRKLKSSVSVLDHILHDLNPIDDEFDKDFILKLIKQGDFIFFLDGFDEIPFSERNDVTIDLQDFISKAGNNLFVLTSRPESALASFPDFQEFNIRPLVMDEAFTLLSKYDDEGELSREIIAKIKGGTLENIHEFLTNPLLVSLLYKSYEHKRVIPFKKHVFYRQVYDALFESHDLTKGGPFIREKYSGLDIEDFHRLLRAIGFTTAKLGQVEFEKDRWLKIIAEAKKLCPGVEFKEGGFLKDLVTTVPLFNRDGEYYRWAHKSIQEYFAAQFVCTDSKGKQDIILKKMAENRNVLKFINILDLCYDIDYKTFRRVISYDLVSEFIRFWSSAYASIDREMFDENDINLRKTLSFQTYTGFMRPGTGMSTDASEVTKEIIQLSRFQQINLEQDYFLRIWGGSPFTFVYCKNTTELLYLLHKKGEDLVVELEPSSFLIDEDIATKGETKIREYLAAKPLLVVTDDPTSVVNDTDTFEYVNWQVLLPDRVCINHEKAFRLLADVEREMAEEAADTFLTDNL
jgi:hypothetical protein